MYQAKHILVTGAAGFIGCHFVRENLQQFKIIGLDKLVDAQNIQNLAAIKSHQNFIFVQGDIADNTLIKKLLHENEIDTIVHFAAESHVDNSIKNPAIFVQTNVMGTQILLQVATEYWQEKNKLNKEVCRFHHISTDEVYGSLQLKEAAFTEQTPYQPRSPYSASKAAADHLVRAYYHTFNLPITISHCSNNFGAYQHDEKFIPTILHSCLQEKAIPVYGEGAQIRDWLYVVDHVQAVQQIIGKGNVGESYNIGGNNEIKNIDLVQQICHLLDTMHPRSNKKSYKELISFVSDRSGHDFRYAINNTKIRQEIGWVPSFNFQAALKETIQFYLAKYKAKQ